MIWVAAMMAAQALMQGEQQKAANKAANIVNQANTQAANIQRTSQNNLAAANGSLQRMQDSLGNRNMLRQAGLAHEKIADQQIDLGRQMTSGGFQARLAAAEQAGALQASASAAGVGGGTITMLQKVAALRSNIEQDDMEESYKRAVFNLKEADDENLYQMYNNLQDNAYIDPIAYSQVVAPQKRSTSMTGAYLNAGMQALGAMYQGGMFNKGGTFDVSQASGGFTGAYKRWFGGANIQQ